MSDAIRPRTNQVGLLVTVLVLFCLSSVWINISREPTFLASWRPLDLTGWVLGLLVLGVVAAASGVVGAHFASPLNGILLAAAASGMAAAPFNGVVGIIWGSVVGVIVVGWTQRRLATRSADSTAGASVQQSAIVAGLCSLLLICGFAVVAGFVSACLCTVTGTTSRLGNAAAFVGALALSLGLLSWMAVRQNSRRKRYLVKVCGTLLAVVFVVIATMVGWYGGVVRELRSLGEQPSKIDVRRYVSTVLAPHQAWSERWSRVIRGPVRQVTCRYPENAWLLSQLPAEMYVTVDTDIEHADEVAAWLFARNQEGVELRIADDLHMQGFNPRGFHGMTVSGDIDATSVSCIADAQFSWLQIDSSPSTAKLLQILQPDRLTTIKLNGPYADDDLLAALPERIAQTQRLTPLLTHLTITNSPVTDNGLEAVAELNLDSLRLRSCQIEASCFGPQWALKELHLEDCALSTEALQGIGKISSLETLNLNCRNAQTEAFTHLNQLTGLQKLQLHEPTDEILQNLSTTSAVEIYLYGDTFSANGLSGFQTAPRLAKIRIYRQTRPPNRKAFESAVNCDVEVFWQQN